MLDTRATAAAEFNGTDSFTYVVTDGTETSELAIVTITVDPVNDAPSFDPGLDQTVAGTVPQAVEGWATAIHAGPVGTTASSLGIGSAPCRS